MTVQHTAAMSYAMTDALVHTKLIGRIAVAAHDADGTPVLFAATVCGPAGCATAHSEDKALALAAAMDRLRMAIGGAR